MKMHKDLDVWNAAVELASDVYQVTRDYPTEEKFGLVSQMTRAAVSIASNIAEGAARQTKKEFVQFLYIASGSASELATQIEISKRISVGNSEALAEVETKREQVSRMLHGLIRSLKNRL